MSDDLLPDPNSFRASGREDLPNAIAWAALPVAVGLAVALTPPLAPLLLPLVAPVMLSSLYFIFLHIRRLFIRYRLTETHLIIPKWFSSISVPLDGLQLSHEQKLGWYPGRMTVKSDSLPAPGIFYLPDSWVDGEPERERFLQALDARGVELDLPGFRRASAHSQEVRTMPCRRIPNGWEKGGAWLIAWSFAFALYYIIARFSLIPPALFACVGAGLFFGAHQRRIRQTGVVQFEGEDVKLIRNGETVWARSLSECEAVHCYYSWPVQMPRRKLILRANTDEHLPLTAWQIEEDSVWLELCEILRAIGCRILLEEADDRDVPHKDE